MDHELSPEALAAYLFLDIAVILVVARLMGALFRRLRQPAVIGEIIGGILLGPSLLGAIPLGDGRNLGTALFPADVRPLLSALANVGLILFMFIVGLELNLGLIRGNERLAAGISLASIILPFGLGMLLATHLYPRHPGAPSYLSFALFIGVSMSITAFPVLARLLTERSMHRIPLGVVALGSAAIDDVLAWSLLAVVTGVADGGDQRRLLVMVAGSIGFVAVMVLVVRPLLRRLADHYHRAGRLTPDVLAVLLVGVLASSFTTSVIGIHAIFGAFMFGAMMPRDGNTRLFEDILRHLEQISVLLFLPIFFVATGFSVDLRGLGAAGLGELGLILLVACTGKFLGAAGAARLLGMAPRTSAALGILMNTRGLTELVILTVGLEKGVLDQSLFTLLVVMAVVTTVMTEPLLRLVYPDRLIRRDIEAAERAALEAPPAFRVLVAVGDVARAEPLAGAAVALLRGREPGQVILSHFRTPRTAEPFEIGSGLVAELGDIAESLDALNRVAAATGTAGVECVVLDRASVNVPADLAAQVTTAHADLVLLDARTAAWRPAAAELLARGFARFLVLDADPAADAADRCVCVLTGDRADTAVLEVAVRLAAAPGAGLVLVDGSRTGRGARKVASLADRIRRAGAAVDARPADALPPRVRLVVSALPDAVLSGGAPETSGRPAAELTVLVRSGPDDVDELDETLRQVRDRAEVTRS